MQSTAGRTAPAPPGSAPRRGGRSVRDMMLSMAALLIPVIALLLAYEFFFNGSSPRAIDPSGTYAAAAHDGGFRVERPVGLPAGWSAISSSLDKSGDGSVLRVSYVPPDKTGLQLIESDRPIDSLLPDELGTDAVPGDLSAIATRQWREYPHARGGSRALVLAENGRTIIVIGTATQQDLNVFAAALR